MNIKHLCLILGRINGIYTIVMVINEYKTFIFNIMMDKTVFIYVLMGINEYKAFMYGVMAINK